MKQCPYCESEEYYIRQSFKGACDFVLRFDGKEVDNGHMHENAEYKNIRKYAYCKKCDKKLFKIDNNLKEVK